MEGHRKWFEQLLNWLTDEAEAWAESGKDRPGQLPMLVNQAPTALLKWKPEHAVRLPDWLHQGWIALGNDPIQACADARQRAA